MLLAWPWDAILDKQSTFNFFFFFFFFFGDVWGIVLIS